MGSIGIILLVSGLFFISSLIITSVSLFVYEKQLGKKHEKPVLEQFSPVEDTDNLNEMIEYHKNNDKKVDYKIENNECPIIKNYYLYDRRRSTLSEKEVQELQKNTVKLKDRRITSQATIDLIKEGSKQMKEDGFKLVSENTNDNDMMM